MTDVKVVAYSATGEVNTIMAMGGRGPFEPPDQS